LWFWCSGFIEQIGISRLPDWNNRVITLDFKAVMKFAELGFRGAKLPPAKKLTKVFKVSEKLSIKGM
jgi:hypothetical protein